MATPEGDVVNAVCEYLSLKRYLFWRNNTYGIFDTKRGVHRTLPKYSRRGTPDIIVVKDGGFVGIECKSAKGKLSPEQHEFGRDLILAGGSYIVARSTDDVVKCGL